MVQFGVQISVVQISVVHITVVQISVVQISVVQNNVVRGVFIVVQFWVKWALVQDSFVLYGTDHCVVQCIFVKTNIGALSTDTVDHGVLQW